MPDAARARLCSRQGHRSSRSETRQRLPAGAVGSGRSRAAAGLRDGEVPGAVEVTRQRGHADERRGCRRNARVHVSRTDQGRARGRKDGCVRGGRAAVRASRRTASVPVRLPGRLSGSAPHATGSVADDVQAQARCGVVVPDRDQAGDVEEAGGAIQGRRRHADRARGCHRQATRHGGQSAPVSSAKEEHARRAERIAVEVALLAPCDCPGHGRGGKHGRGHVRVARQIADPRCGATRAAAVETGIAQRVAARAADRGRWPNPRCPRSHNRRPRHRQRRSHPWRRPCLHLQR